MCLLPQSVIPAPSPIIPIPHPKVKTIAGRKSNIDYFLIQKPPLPTKRWRGVILWALADKCPELLLALLVKRANIRDEKQVLGDVAE